MANWHVHLIECPDGEVYATHLDEISPEDRVILMTEAERDFILKKFEDCPVQWSVIFEHGETNG